MPSQEDTSRAPRTQESDEFARVLSATHSELVAVARVLRETVAQLSVVEDALSSALEPPNAADHAGQLISELRDIRARMLQHFVR